MPENKQTERRRPAMPLMEAERTIAHCRRVTAWCQELAAALWLPQHETAALCDAALMHHHADLMPDEALRRLLEDLSLARSESRVRGRYTARLSDRVLAAWLEPAGPHDQRSRALAALLDHANAFDEEAEFALLNGAGQSSDSHGRSAAFVEAALRRAGKEELTQALTRCPSFPEPARRLHQLVRDRRLDPESLGRVTDSDPSLAAAVLRMADRISMGVDLPARPPELYRLLVACSLQSIYWGAGQQMLWQHSLEAAQVAEQLAHASGAVDPAEAFFAGLLHDAGKAVYPLISDDLNACRLRLTSQGCRGLMVEHLLAGFNHAEAGAELLRRWELDEGLVTGIRWHHQPEEPENPLAAILYLAEFWTDPDEDLPARCRLAHALRLTGLQESAFEDLVLSSGGALPQ